MTFTDIQREVISRYRITISERSDCWGRMHAHVKARRICKWHPKNSIQATFDLLHEIGHIETTTGSMRRAESEYYATAWAIERCREFGLVIPQKTRDQYQRYIDMELSRGLRRGGSGYGNLTLKW